MPLSLLRRRLIGASIATVAALAAVTAVTPAANAAGYPSDTAKPDLVSLLAGFGDLWQSSGLNDLHGTIENPGALARNDELAVWINNNATADQRFRALQDAQYNNAQGTSYDQSFTVSEGFGDTLSAAYVTGLRTGRLPLTQALVNSSTGTAGAYVSTSAAKAAFSYPRPYLPTDAAAQPVAGDDAACAPSAKNGSSLAGIRTGASYADAAGNLKIVRVADAVDTTHEFAPTDIPMSAAYGSAGLCTGGAFPSGHTTTAYQAGITLATLVPELAPELLARASEAGNDRIVLGVHYPLDIMGGRIDGEAALAARWSDAAFRTSVLEPARAELVAYLQSACGGTIAACAATEKAYTDDPYGGKAIPGGTAQRVTDRASAVKVYTERLTYGFSPVSSTTLPAEVPAGASNLLLSAFPTLTDAQRTSVLAQTEIASGFPLDTTATADGSWQRLNLAAALSATVRLNTDGSVSVTATGGTAKVVQPTGSVHGSILAVRGGSATLAGSGFAPGQSLALKVQGIAQTTPVATDAQGAFRLSVAIPADAALGLHKVEVVDAGGATVSRPWWVIVLPSSFGRLLGK